MPKNPHAQALVGLHRLSIPETQAEMRRLLLAHTLEEICVLAQRAGHKRTSYLTLRGWLYGNRRAPDWIKELK